MKANIHIARFTIGTLLILFFSVLTALLAGLGMLVYHVVTEMPVVGKVILLLMIFGYWLGFVVEMTFMEPYEGRE